MAPKLRPKPPPTGDAEATYQTESESHDSSGSDSDFTDKNPEPKPKKFCVSKIKQIESTTRKLRERIPREVLDQDSSKNLIDLPLSYTKIELRCVMRFLCALGQSPTEIDRQLRQVYGDVMCRTVVFKWCQKFRKGQLNLENKKGCGRPKKKIGFLNDIQAFIKSNRHANLRDLGFRMTLPPSTTFNYMKRTVKHKQYLGCWVPIELSSENKEERVKCCLENLDRCKKENLLINFTDRIVVADQTWINFYTTPLNKRAPYLKDEKGKILKREKKKANLIWNLQTGPSPSIKMLMTIFWDCVGVIAIEFKEETSFSEDETRRRYSDRETLAMLYEQICSKRPGLMTSGLALHMNEDLSEEDENTKKEEISGRLREFGWQGLFNPPNSPDLAPSDYHLFQPLRKHVTGKRFVDAEDGKRCVLEWLWEQEQTFYAVGIHDLCSRWEKCVKLKGGYLGS